MALRCGHRTVTDDGTPLADEQKAEAITSGHCPACDVDLEQRTEWVRPYGLCSCCGERWTVVDGKPRYVIFG